MMQKQIRGDVCSTCGRSEVEAGRFIQVGRHAYCGPCKKLGRDKRHNPQPVQEIPPPAKATEGGPWVIKAEEKLFIGYPSEAAARAAALRLRRAGYIKKFIVES